MRLRIYAAIMTGVVAMMLSFMTFWTWTDISISGALVLAVTAYGAALAGVLFATEPQKPKERKNKEPKFFTLKE